MMKFTLKENSWHFWLANFGTRREYASHGTDICSYVRSVIAGTFLFLLVASVVLAFATWFGAAIANFIGWLLFDYELEKYAFAFFYFFGTLFGGLAVIAGSVFTKEYMENRMERTEPGFVRLAYRSWKDKFCAKIEFE